MSKKKSEHLVTNEHLVTVDYSKSLAEMIKAGKYDGVNSEIISHFSIKGEGVVECKLVLVHLNKVAKVAGVEETLEHLNKMDLTPALIEELLSFAVTYPEVQRKFRVIALGSVWHHPDGDIIVPFLCGHVFERVLGVHICDGNWWHDSYRFLASRRK